MSDIEAPFDLDLAEVWAYCLCVVGYALIRAEIASRHEEAAGARCHEGRDGCCLSCGVEMSTCNVCQGVGYHRAGCAQSDDTVGG